MTEYKVVTYNLKTNKVTESPLSQEQLQEIQDLEKAHLDNIARIEAEQVALANAKKSAQDKLAALGLTPEEISAITGS